MVDAPEAPIATVAAPAAPVVDTAIPAVESAPVIPSVEAPVETVKAETPVPPTVESVLGDAKPAEVKVEASKPEVPKAEVKAEQPVVEKKDGDKVDAPTETKIELPVYEEFKVPEGVSLEKEPLEAFTKILGEIETSKLDHAGMQEKGQALIDLAAKSTTESINRLNDYYVNFHENQKKWFEAFIKTRNWVVKNLIRPLAHYVTP